MLCIVGNVTNTETTDVQQGIDAVKGQILIHFNATYLNTTFVIHNSTQWIAVSAISLAESIWTGMHGLTILSAIQPGVSL